MKRSTFRQAGKAKDVQDAITSAGRNIGAPSLARVEDLFLAALASKSGNRRHFMHLAVTELHELAVRDAQAGMGA